MKKRYIDIGKGKPKICVPIVAKTKEDIIQQAMTFQDYQFDIVELRIDFYQDLYHLEKVNQLLTKLRSLFTCPILFTCRTFAEGGNIEITDENYLKLLTTAIMSENIDYVDIELMHNPQLLYQLIDTAHAHDVKVIMSNHDFLGTPENAVMKERLEKMEILGADVLKIAYMPLSHKDIVRLLETTLLMSEKLTKPIVSMSMGELGKITRICGELVGSAMTFASVEEASAPGQIHIQDMHRLLEAVHHD